MVLCGEGMCVLGEDKRKMMEKSVYDKHDTKTTARVGQGLL